MSIVRKVYLLLLFVCVRSFLISQTNGFIFKIDSTLPAVFVGPLKKAGAKWSQYLKITVPIKVNIYAVNSTFLPFSGITFANGRQNFANAPVKNVLYVTALANQIAGVETNPGESDMDIYFNLATNFYYSDGKPVLSQLDFITTAMHEIGHGLGFYSSGYVNASNIGSFGNIPASAIYPATTSFPWRGQDGVPTIYDMFLVKKSLNRLIDCAAPNSIALGDSIKNSENYFNGPLFANASNLNDPIEVESGAGSFSLGEDLLHLASSFKSTIMSYGWGGGDTVRVPAARELGILKEIGWNISGTVGLKDPVPDKITIDLSPNPAGDYISFSGPGICSVKIYSAPGQLIKREFNSSKKSPFVLTLTDLQRGLFFAEVLLENQVTVVKRFIKE